MGLVSNFSVGRLVNSEEYSSLDLDRTFLYAANDSFSSDYNSNKATSLIGKGPAQIDVEIRGDILPANIESDGTVIYDMNIFSYIENGIDYNQPLLDSVGHSIYEACFSQGLRGDELELTVSKNMVKYIVNELMRIQDYIENENLLITQEESNILRNYSESLKTHLGRFQTYITVREKKNEASRIVNSEIEVDQPLPEEGKGNTIQNIASGVIGNVGNLITIGRNKRA